MIKSASVVEFFLLQEFGKNMAIGNVVPLKINVIYIMIYNI